MPSSKSIHILFIGNSYTNRNDLPGLLQRLASAAKPSVNLESDRVIANGMSLRTHWNRGTATELIQKKHLDFVVLQDQSTMPLKNPARLQEYAANFDDVCRAFGAKTALYLTWARQDAPDRQEAITAAYETAAAEINAIVIPVGIAWQQSLRQHPELILHDRDKSHPSFAGTYLAACTFFGKLFNRDPVGLSADALAPADAVILQEMARTAIKPRRL